MKLFKKIYRIKPTPRGKAPAGMVVLQYAVAREASGSFKMHTRYQIQRGVCPESEITSHHHHHQNQGVHFCLFSD